jgi:hypothetical protein
MKDGEERAASAVPWKGLKLVGALAPEEPTKIEIAVTTRFSQW